MTTETKAKIVAILGDASLTITIFANIPYAFGDVADAFGPTAKKWVGIIGLGSMALLKFTQRAIELFTANDKKP